jgi:MFS family permease
VFGATFTTDPVWAIVWISVALSGLAAAAPVGWSIPSLIAPRGGTATIGGIMNFLNNMMGVVAPITTGYIVGATQSFTGAFLVAGIVLVIGIVAYVFILGRLEPIADPLTARAAGSGAARPLRRIPAIVSFLNPQPVLSLAGGNRSSCPHYGHSSPPPRTAQVVGGLRAFTCRGSGADSRRSRLTRRP